jgi:hypothetical protein
LSRPPTEQVTLAPQLVRVAQAEDVQAGFGTAGSREVLGLDVGNRRMSPSHTPTWSPVFRTIFAQPDPEAVSNAWDEARDQLATSFPKVAH